MKIRLGLATAVLLSTALGGVPARAETILAKCEGKIGLGGTASCTATFSCSVHTIDLEPLPGLDFVGRIQVQVSDGIKVEAHDSAWATRAVQTSGTRFKTVKMADYAPCRLTVIANAPRPERLAYGTFGGYVHV